MKRRNFLRSSIAAGVAQLVLREYRIAGETGQKRKTTPAKASNCPMMLPSMRMAQTLMSGPVWQNRSELDCSKVP